MRILRKDLKHGTVTVLPEILDDLWILYNIVQRNDKIFAKTTREIRTQNRYDRPEKGRRVAIFLGIVVESIMWDPNLNRLRIQGIISDAPEDINVTGSHHALNVDLNRPLTIIKEKWLKYNLDQLNRATKKKATPITVVSVDDEGYCIALVRNFGLEVKVEERANLSGKRFAEERTRNLQDFFKSVRESLEQTLTIDDSPLVVIGIGYVKNDFMKYIDQESPRLCSRIVDVKSVNSTGKAGIYEALRSGVLSKALTQARMSEEAEAVEEVLRRLGKEEKNVAYGTADVAMAVNMGAVEKLLVTDVMLRESPEEERRSLEGLMRDVESKRGDVVIISTQHEAGMKLSSLGGAAALLRFPIR